MTTLIWTVSAGLPLITALVTWIVAVRRIRHLAEQQEGELPPGQPRRSWLTFTGWWAVMLSGFLFAGWVIAELWSVRLSETETGFDSLRWAALVLLETTWHVLLSVVLIRAIGRRWHRPGEPKPT